MTDNYDDTAWPLVDPTPPPSVLAQRATLAAEGQDPQKAGVAYDLAPQVGLPASIVNYDVPATQAEVQSRKDNAVLAQTPQLQQFIADNPIRAAVAAGQYDKLAKINQAIAPNIDDQFAALGGSAPAGDLGELGSMMAEPAVSGVVHGWQERQYGVLANRQRRGEQGLDLQLKEMEQSLATPEDRSFFGGLVNSLGGFVGNIGASAAASWPSMAAGAAVGEAFGPLGAAGGMAAGLGVGILKDQFDVQAGSLYRELGNRTSQTGEPIPENVKQVAALGYATASTMLMAVGGTAMHAGVGALLKDATLRAMAEPGVIAALKRLTLKAGFGSAEFGMINAGIEASHIVATEAAKIGSGSDWNTILNDPATRDQAAGQLGSAIKNGLIFGAILPFTPLGSNPLRDKIAVAQTKYEAAQRERIHQSATDAAENMSPQLVADYLHQNLGLEDVKVPAEEVAKRRDEFGYVRDLDQQLATQLPLGGDVTIPAADYYARTSPETHTALNDKIRGPSGLTPEEANELERNPPNYTTGAPADAGNEITELKSGEPTGLSQQIEDSVQRTTEQIMAGMNLQPAGKQTFLNSILENKAAGLDKQTFDRLSNRVQEVQRDITQKAYDVAYRELMRRERPLWKNELTLETARARADFEKRPDILAYDALVNFTNDNPFQIKLDRNEVDGLFNRESPSDYAAFQKGTRASESLPDKMFRSDGISPDDAAERMGFSSGKELLNSLREYTRAVRDSGGTERAYRDGLIKAEGLRRMEEKDNLTQRVSEQAIDMALSVKQVDVLTAEMHALAPGDTKLTRETVEEAAERHFGNVNAVKAKSEDYRTQVAKWGREAFKLSNSDKPVEALKALQKQLYNFLFAREARIFEKERARTEKLIQRYQQNRSLDNVSQEFTDRIHSILADLNQQIPVQMADLTERLGNKSLLQFIVDQKEKGLDIADTDWLHVKPGDVPKQLEHLTVNEYRQLADTLSSLDKMGRKDRQVVIGEKELDFKIVKERLVRYLKAAVGDRRRIIDGEATGAWNNIKMIGRQVDAVVREPQYMIKRIDDNDPLGPWSQDVYRPMYDQENAKRDRLKDIAESVAKLYDKDWSARSRDLVTNNFRDLDGKPMKITNASKLMMLLNSGNDRNMRLLAHTVGEDVETVRDWLKQNITAKDLEIAHGVLAEFEKIWPDLRKMTENVSGVSPPKVRARGYDTPVGRFEGGYFPSIADPKFMDLSGKAPDLFDRRIYDPATDSRAAHERTGGLYAISFDLNRLPYVIRQTVHDIYMREAVESANRLMSDHDIRSAYTDAFGPEYTRQLEPWLQYIANDGGIPTHDGLWDPYNWSRMARQNAVSVLVGGRVSTALIHGLSAASQSVTEVGIVPFMQESMKLMLRSRENEVTAWDKAMGMSSALRNRLHNVYTSLESEVPKMLNSSNARAEYQAFSTRLIAYFDLMSAVVVFNAKLKKALHDGMSTDDAIWTANRSVDIAHGSNTIVNRPAVMRGGEGSKWFTQFMGFFNNTYNRMRDIGVNVAAHKYMEAMIGTMGFLAATAAVHTIVRYNQKESWQKQLAESGAEVMGGGVPILRDAIHGMMNHGDYGDSMIVTASKGITQPFSDLGKLAVGRNPSKDWVQHLLMSPGFGMGFLPGISGMGPKVLTGHIGDWLTLATTKAGSGHAQFLWDELYRHSLEPPDVRRGILEGNWHQRKAKH